jgi:hypothetical protein
MTSAMGGPQVYSGAFPIPAHQHLYITEEIFDLRHQLLRDSLEEASVPEGLAERWLKLDGAFKSGLVKKSLDDCKGRFTTDPIVEFPDPAKKAA